MDFYVPFQNQPNQNTMSKKDGIKVQAAKLKEQEGLKDLEVLKTKLAVVNVASVELSKPKPKRQPFEIENIDQDLDAIFCGCQEEGECILGTTSCRNNKALEPDGVVNKGDYPQPGSEYRLVANVVGVMPGTDTIGIVKDPRHLRR